MALFEELSGCSLQYFSNEYMPLVMGLLLVYLLLARNIESEKKSSNMRLIRCVRFRTNNLEKVMDPYLLCQL